jgi:crotonobetainyl-CoA:carnitine CoA-transferase CaiB-like acyl-CoA transferase
VELVGSPFHIAGVTPPAPQLPPRLGQHTDEILRDLLGLAPEEVGRLRRDHII